MNQRDLYALLHQIEQCASSAESGYSIADKIESEEILEVQEKLEIVSLELAEIKRNLRKMIGGQD